MVEKVVNITEHRKSLISHREASTTGAELLTVLSNCEAVDLIGALQFDLTPADIATVKTLIGLIKERTERRQRKQNERGANGFHGSKQPA